MVFREQPASEHCKDQRDDHRLQEEKDSHAASVHQRGLCGDGLQLPVNTTTIIKKAQQRLYFLRILRNHHLTQQLLVSFYRCCIESILTYCMCVWFSSCTAANKKALQRVVTTAQKIISCPLPSLEELYNTRCLRKAQKIIKDPSHPGHSLFELLPSGRRYRTLKTRTNRLKNSFYAKAITTLNTATQHLN